MYPPDEPWKPDLDWETPAGETLLALIEALPTVSPVQITVLGSAPLQLALDRRFLSADVDIFSQMDLGEIITHHKLGKGQRSVYIEQVPENVFLVSPTWRDRAYTVQIRHVNLILPHPIDLLVAKIRRLAAKDLEAFDLVKNKTGHPTEQELVVALKRVVDLCRPAFDEENPGGDPITNTQHFWRHLYKKDIDPQREIIIPALEARRQAYGLDTPNHRATLRERLESYS